MIDAKTNTARLCRGRVKDHHDYIEKALKECMEKGMLKAEACRIIGKTLNFSADAIKKHMENVQIRYVRAGKSEPKKKSHKKYESRKMDSLALVLCKCPACEEMHTVKMAPVRPGFVPRIYHPECHHAVKSLDDRSYAPDMTGGTGLRSAFAGGVVARRGGSAKRAQE